MESRKALNQRLNKQLEKRLQFEKLITNLSARFINLPANEIDQQIDNGLKLVVEALQVDRSSLFQFSEDGTEWLITNSFAKEGFETTPRITLQKNFPWVASKIKRGEILRISSLNDLPEEAALDRRSMEQINIKSTLVLPISFAKSLNYVLTLGNLKQERSWDSDIIPRLQLIGEVFANALERKKADEKISTFVEQIKTENIILREEINLTHNFENIIGESNQIRYILHEIEKIAPCDAPVLILGETGTGKELIARAIHSLSSRKEKAFITVDCASLPSDLIESELFGHEKGSFTGAHERRIGRFEIANGSTIFLDEIGELPIELQSKLLRIIESGEYATATTEIRTFRLPPPRLRLAMPPSRTSIGKRACSSSARKAWCCESAVKTPATVLPSALRAV